MGLQTLMFSGDFALWQACTDRILPSLALVETQWSFELLIRIGQKCIVWNAGHQIPKAYESRLSPCCLADQLF